MTETRTGIALVIAGLVIGLVVSAFWNPLSFGGVYNNVTNDFSEGISVDGTTVIDGTRNLTVVDGTFSDDLTVSGGTFEVTTASGATSTLTVGRTVTYATSSATSIRLCPVASSTQMMPGMNGIVYWTYQSCP